MDGMFDAENQIVSLKRVLKEHPNARLTITGGEPTIYVDHVIRIADVYKRLSNNVFVCVNTAGYKTLPEGVAHVNLSVNDYVNPDPKKFYGCTLQTVLDDNSMTLHNIKRIMRRYKDVKSFSFRFLCDLEKNNYNISIWNDLQMDREIKIDTFRVGDFFVYCTFDWMGRHARVTLGDMRQQMTNEYGDGYSNIIIHPDGKIGLNWK